VYVPLVGLLFMLHIVRARPNSTNHEGPLDCITCWVFFQDRRDRARHSRWGMQVNTNNVKEKWGILVRHTGIPMFLVPGVQNLIWNAAGYLNK
jgi:hypothetical protein